MAQFYHEIIEDEFTPTADGTERWQLEEKNYSHFIVVMKALNAGSNTKATLSQLLSAIELIRVKGEKETIYELTGEELYVYTSLILGRDIWQENVVNTDNAVRCLPLIIPFGRRLYDPAECLPASIAKDGELIIQYDIADTGYDNLSFHIEAVSLPEAKPANYLRAIRKRKTPSSTGEDEVDFATKTKYLGIILYGTTIRSGTSETYTIQKVKLLIDGKDAYYYEAHWEALHGMLQNRINPTYAWANHFHMENTASSYTQNADTATDEVSELSLAHYAYLDFDPLGDGQYILDVTGANSLKLKCYFGDTNEARFIPIELRPVG